ncbi:heavy metal-binding domain-containing protein [Salinibius halmophilus]|uniref:heavy metal-binding domain-containing protein n=1 Tax=Salinibius halmophilus TaxID=1853216 RepID=UPI000E67402D|nr:heavy metal-binding domain-containing protein [Salinibius halmophilus]
MSALLWDLIPFISIVLIAAITRMLLTRAHLLALARGEQRLQHIQLRNTQQYHGSGQGKLICAEVVLAVDAFSSLRWAIRSLIGGEAKALQKLTCRARREALLRLRREAQASGSKLVIGVRIEPARLNATFGRNQHRIALRVTGTAIKLAHS